MVAFSPSSLSSIPLNSERTTTPLILIVFPSYPRFIKHSFPILSFLSAFIATPPKLMSIILTWPIKLILLIRSITSSLNLLCFLLSRILLLQSLSPLFLDRWRINLQINHSITTYIFGDLCQIFCQSHLSVLALCSLGQPIFFDLHLVYDPSACPYFSSRVK